PTLDLPAKMANLVAAWALLRSSRSMPREPTPDDVPTPTPVPPSHLHGEPDAFESPLVPSPDAVRGRVLVVDADRSLTDVIRCALGATHDVVGCCDPRDAVMCIVRGHDFDVILFDIDVPYVTAQDFRDEVAAVHPALAERIVLLG